jgi:hypothetical protein
MKERTVSAWHLCSVLIFLVLALTPLTAFGQADEEKKPGITISSMPTNLPGENMAPDPIKGTVTDGDPSEQKVVIYAFGGDRWYVQPATDSPDIAIGQDGTWETETHGGLKFVALLVKTTFVPRPTVEVIPQVGGGILAVAEKDPRKQTVTK